MQAIEKMIRLIDSIVRVVGKSSIWLIFVFMLLMVFEVFMRYFLESPTIWVHETCGYLFAAYIGFSGAWVLQDKGHVSVDVLYQHFPPKFQIIADILVSLMALGMFFVLLKQGYKFALFAFETNQHSHTIFGPLLWPVKALVPISAALFILQLFSDLGKSIIKLKGGEVS